MYELVIQYTKLPIMSGGIVGAGIKRAQKLIYNTIINDLVDKDSVVDDNNPDTYAITIYEGTKEECEVIKQKMETIGHNHIVIA